MGVLVHPVKQKPYGLVVHTASSLHDTFPDGGLGIMRSFVCVHHKSLLLLVKKVIGAKSISKHTNVLHHIASLPFSGYQENTPIELICQELTRQNIAQFYFESRGKNGKNVVLKTWKFLQQSISDFNR